MSLVPLQVAAKVNTMTATVATICKQNKETLVSGGGQCDYILVSFMLDTGTANLTLALEVKID